MKAHSETHNVPTTKKWDSFSPGFEFVGGLRGEREEREDLAKHYPLYNTIFYKKLSDYSTNPLNSHKFTLSLSP